MCDRHSKPLAYISQLGGTVLRRLDSVIIPASKERELKLKE